MMGGHGLASPKGEQSRNMPGTRRSDVSCSLNIRPVVHWEPNHMTHVMLYGGVSGSSAGGVLTSVPLELPARLPVG